MQPTHPAFGFSSQSERTARRGFHLEQGLFGLAPRRDCPFHLAPAKDAWRELLVSVALILPLRGTGVTRSAVLWSPDFPPPPFDSF